MRKESPHHLCFLLESPSIKYMALSSFENVRWSSPRSTEPSNASHSHKIMDKSNTAHLQTLSFAKLSGKDPAELTRLLDASQQQGFFYLDIAGSEAGAGAKHPLGSPWQDA